MDLVPRAPANKAADVEHRPLGGEYPDVSAGVSGACFKGVCAASATNDCTYCQHLALDIYEATRGFIHIRPGMEAAKFMLYVSQTLIGDGFMVRLLLTRATTVAHYELSRYIDYTGFLIAIGPWSSFHPCCCFWMVVCVVETLVCDDPQLH